MTAARLTFMALVGLCFGATGCLLSESDETCDSFADPKSHACREAAIALLRDAGPRPDVPGSDVGPQLLTCADLYARDRVGLIASGRVSGDDSPLICRGNYEEYIVEWVAPTAGQWRVDTNGSDFDTTLGVASDCFSEIPTSRCDDDGGTSPDSLVTFDAALGQRFLFVIQGFNGRVGAFTLSVQRR